MTTAMNHKEQTTPVENSYESIYAAIRTINVEEESNTTLLATPDGRVAQVAKVYTAVRPLLQTIAILPLIPPAWRAALQLFVTTLDGFNASFKAGKDLDPAV